MPAARASILATAAILVAVLGAAGGAFAATGDADPGAVDAGAPVTSAGAKDVKAQIQEWLDDSPAALPSRAPAADGPAVPPDRAIHGEFGVGVGSQGYREIYGVAAIPLGDKGVATVAASETRFNGRRWGGNAQSFGLNLAFGDAARSAGPANYGCRANALDRWEPLWASRMRSRPYAAGSDCAVDAPCCADGRSP